MAGGAFFSGYLSYNHHRSASSSFTPSNSYSCTQNRSLALGIDSSPFTPLRGVATRRVSATSSRFRTCEGVLHWRLLGALIEGDARAAYSRRVVAPSSSLRPLPRERAAPDPLCSARAIDLIQSQSLTHRPCPSAPVHRILSDPPCNGRAVLRKENGSGG